MKTYRWEETEHHYIAIVRPDDLFDLSTLDDLHPEDREVNLKAIHRIHGKRSTYSIAYGKKKFPRRWAETIQECANNVYETQDTNDLTKLTHRRRDKARRAKQPTL